MSSSASYSPYSNVVTNSRLRKERSERKAAAIERSKERQGDHDYFRTKKLLNAPNEVSLDINQRVQPCSFFASMYIVVTPSVNSLSTVVPCLSRRS